MLGAYEHDELPFERLVGEGKNGQPVPQAQQLFDVWFEMEPEQPSGELFDGLTLTEIPVPLSEVKCDLSLTVTEQAGTVLGSLAYRSDLYTTGTIERMVREFRQTLASAIAEPGSPMRSRSSTPGGAWPSPGQ
jgi:hypothetical protein